MSDIRIDALEQQLARTADELAGLQRLVEALVNKTSEMEAEQRLHVAALDRLSDWRDEASDVLTRTSNSLVEERQRVDNAWQLLTEMRRRLAPTPDLAAQLAEARKAGRDADDQLLADCRRKLEYLARDYPGDKETRGLIARIDARLGAAKLAAKEGE